MYIFLPGEMVQYLLIQYPRPLYKAQHAIMRANCISNPPTLRITFYQAVICKSDLRTHYCNITQQMC